MNKFLALQKSKVMRYLNFFLYIIIISFFISCSVNKRANTIKNFINYNQVKNETIISNYFTIDTVSIIGSWENITLINDKIKIPYHAIGLKNQTNDKIILIGLSHKNGINYEEKLSLSENIKENAEDYLFRTQLTCKNVKQHITDNKTFYTFSYTKDDTYRITLVGGSEKCRYEIDLFPSYKNEEKNLKFIIDLFQTIKPK